MEFYSRSENENGEKEYLYEHLEKVAALAEVFAEQFGEAEAGRTVGLNHDLGKASELFQKVLDGSASGVNHESAGAFLLWNKYKDRLLARVVYAHHKGLLWDIEAQLKRSVTEPGAHESRAENRVFSISSPEQLKTAVDYLKEHGLIAAKPKLIADSTSYYNNLPRMLHARMLLSCLCDADYLASAHHRDKEIIDRANDEPLDADKILLSLNEYRNKIIKESDSDPKINNVRSEVFEACLKAAKLAPGQFTLTAPTGTGKTLALLAFAAAHAKEYGKSRIIIVLPFLSIITQNSQTYREICGNVLETHSMAKYTEKTKLFAERWSSPVIITTSVKFFEALFKSQPTDLRFLHNIANSVIVFDEAQSIPADLAGTTMESVRTLCEMFRCTVLFSTATQPTYHERSDISYSPREVIADPVSLYKKTRRVNVEWKILPEEEMPLADIAKKMSEYSSVCCVVNRKDHAHKLYNMIKEICADDECFHISTDMCKAHRDPVISEIKRRTRCGIPCRLVSTSCIEAGVDLDFEVMFRALAPLDSIVQCAGRCNRNGKMNGAMTVFVPLEDKLYPSDFYEYAAGCVKLLNSRHTIDINNPEHLSEYYKELFTGQNHDRSALVSAIADYDFEEAEKQYRLINNAGVNVLVPYLGEKELYDRLAEQAVTTGITKQWIKEAAPITVTSYRADKVKELFEQAIIALPHGKRELSGNWFICPKGNFYDDRCGLSFDDELTNCI